MGRSSLVTILYLLWVFSSTALAVRAVLGVDFGTEYIKATLVKPGIPLEIVLTKDSRRKESSAVAFKPLRTAKLGDFPERLYGSDAIALAARFPGDVYPNLKALLGLPAQNTKVIEYAALHPALKIEDHVTRGTVSFRSGAFSASEESFTVEEIIAMELHSIRKNAEALAGKGSSVKDVVVTVPPFYTVEEKRAIEFAADLASLRVLSLTSDGLAVGLNYATTRTFPSVTEGGKPEHHLVFDMGAGSTKATVLKFQGRTVKDVGKFNKTIQEVQVLGAGWDRTLGGDALNSIIIDDMISSFVTSKAAKASSIAVESVKGHGRAAAKLWKEAERIRHVLSANTESQASFEGLYEDIDFRYKLNRADFEKLAQGHSNRVRPAIEVALQKAQIGIGQLDSVILHGGAVRTPFVQRELETIFGSSGKIRSNVNADESAVFGAGFKGAELSPSFRVKEIKTYDVAGYPVSMKWTSTQGKDQYQQLFKSESLMGKAKTVSFLNQDDFQIIFHQHVDSSENVSPGPDDREILRVSLTNLTTSIAQIKNNHDCTDAQIVTKLSILLNPDNGEVDVTKAVLQCEREEEEKKDSVVDSVKGLFGFGSRKGEQEVLHDSEAVHATEAESVSSSTSSSSETASGSASASPSTTSSDVAKENKSKLTLQLIEIPLLMEIERIGYPQLDPKEILRIKERLAAFDDSDRSRRLRDESLNQLEAFTYRVRDRIDDKSFITVSSDVERASLNEKAKATSEWLYGDGTDADREELRARLKEMKDIIAPVEKRMEEAAARPAKISYMKETLDNTANLIDSLKQQIKAAEGAASSAADEAAPSSTTDAGSATATVDDFAGLEDDESTSSSTTVSSKEPSSTQALPQYTVDDLTEVISVYERVSAWFKAKQAEQEALPMTADPVLLVDELQAKSQELTTASMNVVMKAMKAPERDWPKRGDDSDDTSGSSKSSKTKTSKTKNKTSKTKKPKATKSKSSNGPMTTDMDFGDGKRKTIFEVGDDGLPTEEDILAAIRENEKATESKKDEL